MMLDVSGQELLITAVQTKLQATTNHAIYMYMSSKERRGLADTRREQLQVVI